MKPLMLGVLLAAALPAFAANPIIEEGKALAFDRTKGNCLACHAIQGGDSPGTIGPPLINMRQRFPDKQVLWEQIWDATQRNPSSIMPPFGPNYILGEDEFYKVVEFIWSL